MNMVEQKRQQTAVRTLEAATEKAFEALRWRVGEQIGECIKQLKVEHEERKGADGDLSEILESLSGEFGAAMGKMAGQMDNRTEVLRRGFWGRWKFMFTGQ